MVWYKRGDHLTGAWFRALSLKSWVEMLKRQGWLVEPLRPGVLRVAIPETGLAAYYVYSLTQPLATDRRTAPAAYNA